MRNIVAGHEAVTPAEFAELAFGIDLELFAGPATESDSDRMARLDVAREILAELRESDPQAAAYAAYLLRTSPLGSPVARPARRSRTRRQVRQDTARAAVAA
ncbi:hypothetical protein [Streptomyces sp. NPDC002692]